MIPDLQTAIDDIEVRAADMPRDVESARSCAEPSLATTPATTDLAEPAACTEPITATESGVDQIEPHWRCVDGEPTDPYQDAAHQVLKQLGDTTKTSLLLLAETPPPTGRPKDLWGHAFAELIDEPVLMIELVPASPREPHAPQAADGNILQITQSEHPGLCTLATAWYTLKGKQADRWWSEAWESFGMILLDGSGLDLASTESILPRCTHVLFLVEYENTSRSWATQIGKLIATHRIRTVGCIATASPHAA